MSANLNVQLILSLVNNASGPLKQAMSDLQGLGKGAEGAAQSSAGVAGHARDIGRAFDTAGQASAKFGAELRGVFAQTASAGAGLSVAPWVRQQQGAQQATQEVKRYTDEVRGAHSAVGQLANQVLGLVAAHAGLKLAKDEFEAGAKGVHREVAMETSGMSPGEIRETQARARELTGQFPTQDRSEIEGLVTETRSIVGDMHEALELQPDLLRLKTIAEAEHGGKAEGFANIVKGLEIAGVTQDMGKFRGYLNDMAQAMNVFKHTIRPEDYFQFFKYAGSQISRNLDREYISGPAATIMQELRGSTAGFAHRAFVSEVFASRLSGKAAGQLDELGLVTDESKVERKKDGTIKWLKPGAIEGSDLAIHNPMRWVHEVLDAAMTKKGLDRRGRDEAVASIFENSNARQLVDILLNQKSRIDKDTALVRKAKGLEAADDWIKKDASTGVKSLGAQWENFKRQSAEPIMPLAVSALNKGASLLTGANHETERRPWLATGASAAAIAGAGWLSWRGMQGGLNWWRGAGAGAGPGSAGAAAEGASAGGVARGIGKGLLGAPRAALKGLAEGAAGAWAELPAESQAALKAAGAGVAKGVGKGLLVGATFEGAKYGLDKGLDAADRALGVNQEPWRRAQIERTKNRGLFDAGRDLVEGIGDYAAGRPYGYTTAQREHMPLSPQMQTWESAQAPAPQAATGEAGRTEVDTAALDAARTKAEETATAVQAVGTPVAVQIDSASADATLAKLQQIVALVGQIGSGLAGLAASAGRATGALHDGYEAH